LVVRVVTGDEQGDAVAAFERGLGNSQGGIEMAAGSSGSDGDMGHGVLRCGVWTRMMR
jgi:hypothetical protein